MPTSFKVFLAVILIFILVIVGATLIQIYSLDQKYNIVTACFLFLAFSFMPVGIYAGIKEKKHDGGAHVLNKVGLIGNFVFYLVICVFITTAIMMKFF